jgi:hypothetical protein
MQDTNLLLLAAIALMGGFFFLYNQLGPNRYHRRYRYATHDPFDDYDSYDPYSAERYPPPPYDPQRFAQSGPAYHQRERWFRQQFNARQLMDSAIFLMVVAGVAYWVFVMPK